MRAEARVSLREITAASIGVEHVRSVPCATELRASYVSGERTPGGFYVRCGFEDGGELDEAERVLRLPLA